MGKFSLKKGHEDSPIAEDFFFGESLKNLQLLSKKYQLSYHQIANLLLKYLVKSPYEDAVPLSVFSHSILSPLEALAKYFREERNLSLKEIAGKINRDGKTVWISYAKARKKDPKQLRLEPSDFFIPCSVFQRKKSILESVVAFLKEDAHLSFQQIAALLKRDQRNIWSIYQRSKKNG